MNHYHDPFFCIPRTSHATSEGSVDLPILYHDTTAALVFFRCHRDKVSALLPRERLVPAFTWRSRAIVGLALFEYRTTSIGRYNEVGLAVPATWTKGPPACAIIEILRSPYLRRVGYHIVDLPVTTKTACAAGRELWGYPKFVTLIDFSLQRKQLHCRVHDPEINGDIMSLTGTLGPGVPCPALDMVTFECRGNQDQRTIVQTRGGGHLHGAGSVRLEVGDSTHPMAERLRRLGLQGARPLAMWVSTRFQSRLNAGAPLEALLQKD